MGMIIKAQRRARQEAMEQQELVELQEARKRQANLRLLVPQKSEVVLQEKAKLMLSPRHLNPSPTLWPRLKNSRFKSLRNRLVRIEINTWMLIFIVMLCLIAMAVYLT